jgi:hypothetical protein
MEGGTCIFIVCVEYWQACVKLGKESLVVNNSGKYIIVLLVLTLRARAILNCLVPAFSGFCSGDPI